MVDRKIGGKEALELKERYNQDLHRRKGNTKNTQFKVEDLFGDVGKKNRYLSKSNK